MTNVDEYVAQELFCINLKWYRFQRGLSQERLAELSNTTSKYISDLERGKFCPSLSKMQDIARALNIETYELLIKDHVNDVIKNKRIDEKK